MNQSELAESFGVSRRTVADWDREGLSDARISEKPVRYDGVKAWEWRWANKLPQTSPAADAKTRKLEAEAATKEVELEVLRGTLVSTEAVRQRWMQVLTRLRAKIVAFKGALAPRLVNLKAPREAKAVLDSAFDELLEVLSDTASEIDDEAAA